MEMMINRRRVCGGKSLHYDAKIEYLQSNGVDSQYIQLPIGVQEGLDIHCKFSIVEASNYGYIFGNQQSASDYLMVTQYGTSGKIKASLLSSGATESLSHIGDIRDIHIHFWNESQTCLLDDTTLLNKSASYNRVSKYPIRLWYPTNGDYFKSKVRIYSFSIYLHNQLVLDLVPVKDNGVGYMYDKVSGTFFGNSGTGNFILGPDK